MKRFLITLLLIVTTITSIYAQPRLSSNKSMHNMGQIEWKHPVTVEYLITNTGDKPLVINNVTASCACTDVAWNKQPIAAGDKGIVKVTFDAKALGRFEKSIGIYSNSTPNLVYLKFNGEVVAKITDYTKTHPYQIGDIKLNRNEFDFPDAQRGEKPVIEFSIVNNTDRPYIPILMHLPHYLKMETKPNVLQKGEKGNVKLTLNTNKLLDLGLTQTSVYLARFVGDKVGEENEIPVSAILLPDLSSSNEIDKPQIHLSTVDIDFVEKLQKKNKATQDIFIVNEGKSPLKITKLQVFNSAINVDLKKTVIQAGEATRLRVTVRKNKLGKNKKHMRILMITNDPDQPKVIINVKQ